MTILLYTMITLLVIVSLFLILLVLIQKGRGGGLSSAFGGVGGHTAFGSKTGDVLTWATSVLFGIFLILSVITGLVFERVNTQVRRPGGPGPAPISAPAPATDDGPTNVPSQVPAPAQDPGVPSTPTPTPTPTPAPTTR